MDVLEVTTTKRVEFIDITSKIERAVRDSKVREGICVLFCPHTTAGLTINENADPSVKKDIINHLEKLVPPHKSYFHLEGNADSHIKSSIIGASLNLIIEDGRLVLGTWQGIYLAEFDGPRRRQVYIKII
jgi:secondary thiamine-phosphate synthase enzyme